MRLSCTFKCNKFPIAYQMLGVSLIKQALEQSNPEYFNKLYKYENKSNKKSKSFCFSVFVNDYELQSDVFKVNEDVIFNFSTPDMEFGINLYNGLLSIKEFEYKGFKLERQRVFIKNETIIPEGQAIFKTLSPIFIKDKNGQALMPYDKNFENEFNYIIDLSLKNYRGYGLNKPIQIHISSESIKKKVIKQEISGFEKLTSKKTLYTNAFTGIFKLNGSVEDLNDIYKLGIGFRRSQGFGMIEVV